MYTLWLVVCIKLLSKKSVTIQYTLLVYISEYFVSPVKSSKFFNQNGISVTQRKKFYVGMIRNTNYQNALSLFFHSQCSEMQQKLLRIVTLSREQKNYCSSWWILLHYEQPSITTHFNIVGLITRVPLLILQCTKRAPFYSRHRDGLTLRIIALRMKVDELDDDKSGRVGVDLVVRLGVWRVH